MKHNALSYSFAWLVGVCCCANVQQQPNRITTKELVPILYVEKTTKTDYLTRLDLEKIIKESCNIEKINWDSADTNAMLELAWRESRYKITAQNKKSSAYGLFQFLDNTWGNYNVTKCDIPHVQVIGAIRYIKSRYTTPIKALEYHKKRGYY